LVSVRRIETLGLPGSKSLGAGVKLNGGCYKGNNKKRGPRIEVCVKERRRKKRPRGGDWKVWGRLGLRLALMVTQSS